MSELGDLAARLLCVGFHGDDAATVDAEALAELGPAGLVLFARNVTSPEGTRALVARVAGAIGERTGRRPFVGVDQEGGRVARLREGAVAMPSAMALGAAADEGLAEAAGRALASDARRFGCDVDFAPVLDLALVSESRVVGTRAFGDDPERVGALGAAVARGLAAGGVAAVVKHAPGHGATGTDSHDALPHLTATAATLEARDLVPFRIARAAGARAAMLAHVVVAEFGPAPASLNPGAIALVRRSVGNDTMLLTDCLQMRAISESIGTAEAATLAIGAGADLAIVSHDLDLARAAASAIARDVASGRIPRARFEAALAAVERFRTYASSLASIEPGDRGDGDAVARAVAAAAIAVLRAPALATPLRANEAVTVVSFEGVANASAEGQGLSHRRPPAETASLALALRRLRVRAEMMRVPLAPSDAEIEALELVLEGQGERRAIVLARGARHAPSQASAIARILAVLPAAIVVCAGEPFDLAVLPGAPSVLATFGDGPAEMEALAEALLGRHAVTGTVPVSLGAAGARA